MTGESLLFTDNVGGALSMRKGGGGLRGRGRRSHPPPVSPVPHYDNRRGRLSVNIVKNLSRALVNHCIEVCDDVCASYHVHYMEGVLIPERYLPRLEVVNEIAVYVLVNLLSGSLVVYLERQCAARALWRYTGSTSGTDSGIFFHGDTSLLTGKIPCMAVRLF